MFFKKGNGFQSENKKKANKLYLSLYSEAKMAIINERERIEHNGLIINVSASSSTSVMLTAAVQEETKKLLKKKILPPNSSLDGVDVYIMVRQFNYGRIAIYT